MTDQLRILLVEDDDDDVVLTREYVEEAFGNKYSLDHVATIEDALGVAAKDNHDIYLVDFRLGSDDGIDFIREVTSAMGLMVPIILLTGQDDLKTDLRAMEAGATDFLVKQTINARSLERSIRYSINQKRAEARIKLLAHEAEQANEAKSSFLATMSHELRTPLNAISGFSEILTNEMLGPLGSDKYKEYANDICNSSEHLLNLINDILDLSAIEAGKLTLVKEVLNVNEMINDLSPIIASGAKLKGIKFMVDMPEQLPPLLVDQRALKQIMLNILANAVKFTPEEGRVTLKVTASTSHHIFEVRDTGMGVSKDKLANLTNPFFRAETNPHMAREGTGLGLSIVKSLVDLHDGKLEIESEVNEGMTIIVTLPSD